MSQTEIFEKVKKIVAEQLCQEANILLKARHPGVIYLHEVFENNAEFTLVLEL